MKKNIILWLFLLPLFALCPAAQTPSQYQYWIDSSDALRQGSLQNGEFKETIDFSAYPDGLHLFTFRASDSEGRWSAPRTSVILKNSSIRATGVSEIEYWIDDISRRQSARLSGEGIFTAEIDFSTLTDGLHLFSYRATDNKGRWSAPRTSVILKNSETESITAYQYWYNRAGVPTTVELGSPASSPYELAAVLPFESADESREEVYRWTADDGHKEIRYLNRVHLRFRDSKGSWSEIQTDTFGVVLGNEAVNFSGLIVNPKAESGREGWTLQGSVGNFVQNVRHYAGSGKPYFCLGNSSASSWESSMEQVVSDLPAGTYVLSVKNRAALDTEVKLWANDEYADLPAYGEDGGEIWQDAAEGSAEKLVNDGKGYGWSRTSLIFTTDGNPVTIKATAKGPSKNTWADFVDFELWSTNTSGLTVAYADGINAEQYKNMRLILTGKDLRIPLATTSERSYVFRGIDGLDSVSVALVNNYGQTIWSREKFTPQDCGFNVLIDKIAPLHTLKTSVRTPSGEDVTDKIRLKWLSADGSQLAAGRSIEGFADGSMVVLDVVLGDSLGVIYTSSKHLDIRATAETAEVNVTLSALEKVSVAGKVYGNNSQTLSNATVKASQIVGGLYPLTTTATTDNNGNFVMELPADSCRFTASCSGYINSTVSVADPTAVGRIELQPIRGDIVSLNMRMLRRCKIDAVPDTTVWSGNTGNLQLRLVNVSQGVDSVPFILQDNILIVESGLTPGEQLTLAVHSLTGEFADVLCPVVVGDDGSAVANCLVSERGSVEVTVAGSNNQETRALLFDADGRFRANEVMSFNGRASFEPLESGNYTVVVLGQSDLFGNVASLSSLDDSGLEADEDYLSADVYVAEGKISDVALDIVPAFEDSGFYYTSEDASFTVNKTTAVAGSYVTYTARIDFKEEYAPSISDLKLTIDIPKEFSYVANSAIVGSSPATVTEGDNSITIYLTEANYRDRIRFCLMPFDGGETYTHATLCFNCEGEKIQPFGRLKVDAEAMKIKLPYVTHDAEIIAIGNCLPNSTVVLYDGDEEIGMTTSRPDGSWRLPISFGDPINLSKHPIVARIITDGFDRVFSTETKPVEYNMDANRVKSVTMINTAHGPHSLATKQYVTEFDFINPKNDEKIYWFWPKYPTFTFVVDFLNNSPEYVENVFVKVHTSSGDTKTLKANYSASKGRWIATGDFNSFCMPRNVSVAFDKKKEERKYDNRAVDNDMPLPEDGSSILREIEKKRTSLRNELRDFFAKTTKTFEEFKNILVEHDCFYEVDQNYQFPSDVLSAVDKLVRSQTRMEAKIASRELKELIDEKTTHFRAVLDSYTEYYNLLQNGGEVKLEDIEYKFSKNYSMTSSHLKSDDYNEVTTTDGKTLYVKCGDGFNWVYDPAKLEHQSFKWTPEGIDLSNSTIEQMQGYLDREYSSYISDLKERPARLTDEASWLEKEFALTKNTWGLVIEKAKNGIYESWIDEAKEDNFEFGLNAGLYLKFGVKKATDSKLYKILKEGGKIASEYDKGKNQYKDYEDWFDKYAPCFGPIEGSIVGAEIKALQFVEAAGRVEKYLGLHELERMIDGNLKNLPDGWPKNLLSFLKDYALAPINRGIDASIDGYHTIAKGMLNDLVDGCDPENPLQPEEEEESPDGNSNDQQDPSGYVYEAVTSNRLPGVTASIYKKEVTTDMYGDKTETAVFWDAERYMQQNPQTTDDMGKYGWDVPQGEWQVRFSKPGYEPEETEWLPVPPPQLDVNIGMRHAVSPKVEGAVGRESGITVTFDKYMRPETFADTTLTVSRGEENVEGKIEMVNLESEPVGGNSYASKVKFKPRKQFTAGETVMLRVAHGCISYADMPLADDVVLPVVILPDIHEIATDPAEVRVFIGENRTVNVTVSPATASAGHLLKIVNASPLLATVGTESVRLDGNGQASFSVRGEMPGVAQLQLSVEGYDLTAELPVDVLWKVEKVANPVASISSESAVAVGTPVALKCSTAGSHIYYTTDGSDPADEANPSRLLYKTPLIVDRTVTIKAVGMMEGVDRSDVVEFRYSTVITGVSGPVAPSADVVVENGAIVVRNCNATSCEIFNAAGIKIWSRTDLYGEVRVPVTGGPVFIVRTVGPDGHVSATTVIVN